MNEIKTFDTKYYNGSICYRDDLDEPVLRDLKIVCPECGREFAAMLSKYTALFGLGPTVSEEEPATIYKTMCYKCKTAFAFCVDWSQHV